MSFATGYSCNSIGRIVHKRALMRASRRSRSPPVAYPTPLHHLVQAYPLFHLRSIDPSCPTHVICSVRLPLSTHVARQSKSPRLYGSHAGRSSAPTERRRLLSLCRCQCHRHQGRAPQVSLQRLEEGQARRGGGRRRRAGHDNDLR